MNTDHGKLPVVSIEFLRDALDWHRMLLSDSVACSVHGLELQREMDKEYPAEWMAILYQEGRFEEEPGNPYVEGYNACYDGKRGNPYRIDLELGDTEAWDEWNEGWETAEAELRAQETY